MIIIIERLLREREKRRCSSCIRSCYVVALRGRHSERSRAFVCVWIESTEIGTILRLPLFPTPFLIIDVCTYEDVRQRSRRRCCTGSTVGVDHDGQRVERREKRSAVNLTSKATLFGLAIECELSCLRHHHHHHHRSTYNKRVFFHSFFVQFFFIHSCVYTAVDFVSLRNIQFIPFSVCTFRFCTSSIFYFE